MRSRSTCDANYTSRDMHEFIVSISDEKPLHMRRRKILAPHIPFIGFNLR